MNDQNQGENKDKKYTCSSCGSESSGTPGTCCGGERKEKCESCGTARKNGEGKDSCGCKA